MIKIVVASDNHGDLDSIKTILEENHNYDYYLHTGDSCVDPSFMVPFSCVKGNNDYFYDYPQYRVIKIDENNTILMIHGHQFIYNKDKAISMAKENYCNIVLYGHTHVFNDEMIDGIRLINPGSCYYNRDRSEPCYARIYIDNNIIKVERINLL